MYLRIPLILLCVVVATHARGALLGDLNGDGIVDVGDLVLVARIVDGSLTPTAEQRDAADVAPIGVQRPSPPIVDASDLLIFTRAIHGDDVDGDGLDADTETGGPYGTSSPFLRDTDGDGLPDEADTQRATFLVNQPPDPPSLEVTGSSTTSLSGTVTACSNPGGLPHPSICTQIVVAVAAGASCEALRVAPPVSPVSGTWSLIGLLPGVVYTLYGVSSDGALSSCSSGKTAATVPTGTAAVVPHLSPVSPVTQVNPLTVSGTASPGQQIRVFVNGAEQDFVRTFATGNPAMSPSPFVVPTTGVFSVPVVLDDGLNRVAVTAISGGSVESAVSNEVAVEYQNVIPRSPTALRVSESPLSLPLPMPDDTDSEEVVAGRILVLTKGDVTGYAAEYYVDHHIDVKANALFVIGAGAQLRFAGPTPYKRKIIVGGTLHTRGTAAVRAKAYHNSPTSTSRDQWSGIEVQSTSRGTVIAGLSMRNMGSGIVVTGTTGSRPDIELRDSHFDFYPGIGLDVTTGGTVTATGNEFIGFINGAFSQCLTWGISVSGTTQLTARNNYVKGVQYGIKVVDSAATIQESKLDSGSCNQPHPAWTKGAAIYVKGSPAASITWNNIARDSTGGGGAWWWAGILVENSSPTIENNRLDHVVSGVEILTTGGGSSSPVVRNNSVEYIAVVGPIGDDPNASAVHGGVVIRDGAGATVQTNRFGNLSGNPAYSRGVFIKNAGSAPIEVSDNEITHLLIGVHIENTAIPSGESISIHDNAIGYMTLTGLVARYTDATIQSNTIATGFVATQTGPISCADLYSTTVRFEGNTVSDAKYGIRVFGGSPEIVGNLITANFFAGVRLDGTSAGTLVQANRVEANLRSSSVSGSTGFGILIVSATGGTVATINAGNVISGNTVGIRIEGLANSATNQPVPVISGNAIYGNADPPATGATHNIEIVGYSTPSQTTLDVTANWWNSTNQTTITSGIVYLNTPGSGLQPVANIDFANVVTAPNTNFFVGQLGATVGADPATKVYFTPNLSGTPPPVAAIKFVVYDPGAGVVARVCPEQASSCTSANAVYSTTSQTFSAGAATINWDGADSAGKLVTPEAYQYVLEATKGSVTQVVGSAIENAFVDGALVNPQNPPAAFDGYGNARFMVKYRSNSIANYPQPGPLRVSFEVRPRDANGFFLPAERFVTGPEGYSDGAPIPWTQVTGNLPWLVWNSRHPVSGQILSGDVVVVVGSEPMRRNVILVSGSRPTITSDTGAIDLKAEPRLVYDTFEQVAAISYRVDRLSDVTISLLPPNSWDDTSAPTWTYTSVPANTTQLFQFRGHEVAGMSGISVDSARNLLTSLTHEGAFTFRVRATDQSSNRTAETTVTVQVRH